jgi:hypothetical protein
MKHLDNCAARLTGDIEQWHRYCGCEDAIRDGEGGKMLKTNRPMWSVWHDEFDPKYQWCVQMPKGIIGFPTKQQAERFAALNAQLTED